MRHATLLLLIVSWFGGHWLATFAQEPKRRDKPYPIEKRVPWTTSRLRGAPNPPPPYGVVKAFPKLQVSNPIYIEREPGTDHLLLIHQTKAWSGAGRIRRFKNDPAVDTTQLLWQADRLIYGLTFHPNYQNNGYLYVCSNGPLSAKNKRNRISRFTIERKRPHGVVPGSELVVLEWESNGHNGGDLEFGPDGMLYIPTGDGTSDSDTLDTGQDISNLLAVMIRVDVDRPANGKPYSIPPDNPFVKMKTARPEVWAYGFRNPWRMTFDKKNGHLWVAQNGQDLWEQVYLVRPGENYGWSVYEGSHPFHLGRRRGPTPIVKPTLEHSHSQARSLTGGIVYYGAKLAPLNGVYVYGDWSTGRIWGARHDGRRVTWHRELARTTLQITGFGTSPDGDLLICDHGGGVFKLVESPHEATRHEFPTKLSETGLFQLVKDHKPQPGVIPYSVNAPVWADGAHQERFVALPGMSQIQLASEKAPDGSVFVKTLSLELEEGNPASRRRIETQILLSHLDEWAGYTYAWNEEQTDARLVPEGGMDRVLKVKQAHQQGLREQTWRFASRVECMACHSRAAKFVLGFRPRQLNRTHDYASGKDNQLRTLAHIALIDKQPPKEPPKLANPYDASADLQERARAYLHVNCSICHVQAGGGNAAFHVDYANKPEKMDLINAIPKHDRFGMVGAKLVAPGDPYRSVLYYRMATSGSGRMPRAGSTVVDARGLRLIRDWITSLPADDGRGEHASVKKTRADQLAAVATLRAARDDRAGAEVIAGLLDSTSGALLLLEAVAAGELSQSIRREVIAKAAVHTRPSTRDLFEQLLPSGQRVKRLGTSVDPAQVLALTGNAARGQHLFLKADGVTCRTCHRLGAGPQLVGPDLSRIGKDNAPADLLEHILEPSRKIEAKYRVHIVETVGGRVYSGVLVAKNKKEVVLQDPQNKSHRIPAAQVAEMFPGQKSLMPELLVRDMTAQQLADLIAFLASLK